MAGELIVQRANSKLVGLDVAIFDRVMDELIFHMHNLKVDETELAYLKAMAIFDAGRFDLRSRSLKEGEKVEELLEALENRMEIDDTVTQGGRKD